MRSPPGPLALSALYDHRGGRPVVCYAFLALCLLITIPSLLAPSRYGVFGGIDRRYPWQLVTAVFEHGWPGFHGAIHLALNSILILEAGRPCERLLGRGRFFLLCAAAIAGNAILQVLRGGVNGSSLVIWAWGPALFVAWRAARAGEPAAHRIGMILAVMYVVVSLAMSGIPYAYGWRGNPVVAVLIGNQYHLAATAVGIVFALLWRTHIRRRLGVAAGI